MLPVSSYEAYVNNLFNLYGPERVHLVKYYLTHGLFTVLVLQACSVACVTTCFAHIKAVQCTHLIGVHFRVDLHGLHKEKWYCTD